MLPTIKVGERKVLLVSGFVRPSATDTSDAAEVTVEEIEQLRRSVRKHAHAVAFGFVNGVWCPAA